MLPDDAIGQQSAAYSHREQTSSYRQSRTRADIRLPRAKASPTNRIPRLRGLHVPHWSLFGPPQPTPSNLA